MIVPDENLLTLQSDKRVQKWYPGRVCYITSLRPNANIKDKDIPTLLQQTKGATFVTTNTSDFWKRVSPHPRYCIICFLLPNEKLKKLPTLLQQLFHLPPFHTKSSRTNKIVRVTRRTIQYYTKFKGKIHTIPWPDKR